MADRTILLQPLAAVLPDGSTGNLAPQRLRFQGTETSPKKHFHALAFDGGGGKEIAWWVFRMPADYSSGGAVAIQWMLNGTANAVVWSVQLGAVTPGDADTPLEHASAAASSATTNVNTTEARRLTETSITVANLDSVAAGDLVFISVYRDSADGSDTATQDAELVAAAFTYTGA